MKPLSPVEIIANTYEGLAPVPMDLARRVRVEQLRRRREAGQRDTSLMRDRVPVVRRADGGAPA